MARAAQADAPKTVTLVSPDGEQKREVVVGSADDVKARWDGYLPAEQAKLEAPAAPASGAEKTVGTNA